jgi:hypothetical protein
MNDERGSWYLLTAIILGIVLGLLYSWAIAPAEYVDTPPFSLREDFKDQYRTLIAIAYNNTGDLPRAQARLRLLKDENPALVLVAQAQRYLAAGENTREAQSLANLASALGLAPTSLPTQPEYTATPGSTRTSTLPPTVTDSPTPEPSQTHTPSPFPEISFTATTTPTRESATGPTRTPTISSTPRDTLPPTETPTLTPSKTPTATLAPPFVLNNQVMVCNSLIGEPQLQVFVSNAAGVGIPGVEIIVTWNSGEEHFFTGLKPDIDIGYADFTMAPDVNYTLQAAEGGQLITNLTAPDCTDDAGDPFLGSWRLVFSHP